MNQYNLTVEELKQVLRKFEYELDRSFVIKDNAFTYDLEGYLESIQDDTRLFEFNFDCDQIRSEGVQVATFTMFYDDPRNAWS